MDETVTILERKHNYNKPDQEFACELLYQDGGRVVLRYVTDRDYAVSGRVVRAGSSTLGLYDSGARQVFWKMLDPEGRLEAYLVHLCEPISIEPGVVTYRDRMLDLWQEPPSAPVLLDEDELQEAQDAGLISGVDAEETRDHARQLLQDFDGLVSTAEAALQATLERR